MMPCQTSLSAGPMTMSFSSGNFFLLCIESTADSHMGSCLLKIMFPNWRRMWRNHYRILLWVWVVRGVLYIQFAHIKYLSAQEQQLEILLFRYEPLNCAHQSWFIIDINHNDVYVYMTLFVELVILFSWLDYFGLNSDLCVWICMPGLQCSVEEQVHGISLAEEIGWWASLGCSRIFNICRFRYLDNSVFLKMCQAFEIFIWVSGHNVFISRIFKCIWNSTCLGWLTDPASATWRENHICAAC